MEETDSVSGRLLLVLCFVFLLAALAVGCGHSGPVLPTDAGGQMKGYELYSWQDSGQWYFAVLAGTNRDKTIEEIRAPATSVKGENALEAIIRTLPSGQFVTWRGAGWDGLAYPPESVIERVKQLCAELGVQFYVPSSAGT